MSRILGIGIATLDIINSVDGYPAEDKFSLGDIRGDDRGPRKKPLLQPL